MKKEIIAVSACLLGENCKYDGTNNKNERVLKFLEDKEYVAICPEMLGNLPCPRYPSEIICDQVINSKKDDVTKEFTKGAEKALDIAMEHNVTMAILKESSPSCGVNLIYDGTFTGKKIKGMGKTACLFKKKGIKVITEKDV